MATFSLKLPFFGKGASGVPASAPATRKKARFGSGGLQILALIGLVFMVPLGVTTYFLAQEQHEQIVFAEKELGGAQYASALRDFSQLVLTHRGIVRRILQGEEAARPAQVKTAAGMRKAISGIDAVDARFGAVLGSTAGWSAIKADWVKVETGFEKLTPAQARDQHTAVNEAIVALVSEVAARSNLLLDPQLDVNYLSRLMTFDVPIFSSLLGDIRFIGSAITAAETVTPQDGATAQAKRTEINDQAKALRRALVAIFEANPAIKDRLEAKSSAALKSTAELMDLLTNQVLKDGTPQIKQAEWQAAATKTINTAYAFGDAIGPEHRQLVEARVAKVKSDRNQTLSVTAGCVFLALIGLLLLGRRLLAFTRERAESATRDERAMRESETNRQNQAAILRLMNEMEPIANGNLVAQATVDEQITGAIADSVNATVAELRKLVVGATATAAQVTQGATSAQKITQQLLAATKKQAHEIGRAGTSVELITRSIGEVNSSATQSAQSARKSLATTERGATAVQSSVKSMNVIRDQIQETAKRVKRLGESSQEIGEIVELISDITEQTNVLALNAAIQAASAGEAGRGFAVVAEEVQRLAERSADATKQIGALAKAIQTDTQDAVAAMEKSTEGVVHGAQLSEAAGVALGEIERATRDLSELVQSIAVSTEMQVDIAREVASGMKETLALTEQATQGVNETAKTVADLATQAESMRGSVARFKVA